MKSADELWFEFIKKTNRNPEERCSGDLTFESRGIKNDSQIAMILSGQKKAIFSALSSYLIDSEPLPLSGECYIVFDRAQNPLCIIETEEVEIVPFNQVTWEMAQKEGEDNNLEEWKEKQRDYLETEAEIVGFNFTEDLKLVYQTFNVVYKNY